LTYSWRAWLAERVERTCDALAQGELKDLGLSRQAMIEELVKRVVLALT
jgi:uncharacterized protein YjiS (DUF1127 family)